MNSSCEGIISSLFDLPEQLRWINNDLLNFPVELAFFLSSLQQSARTEPASLVSCSLVSATATVGHFSIIRNSIIGEGVRVGAHVEIANSIILADAVIPHHNYIGYSIIGNGVKLGGNTRTAVRRLDDDLPRVNIPGMGVCYASHKKIGAFIGDQSRIGSSVVFMPLTIVGRSCLIDPGLIVSGYHMSGARIRNSNIVRPSFESLRRNE